MDETVARFEFRTFAPHMGTTEQRVRALSPCDSISESREIYLLDCENALENNVKIRDGRLDLKRLVERRQGLERWKPAGHRGGIGRPAGRTRSRGGAAARGLREPVLSADPVPTAGQAADARRERLWHVKSSASSW